MKPEPLEPKDLAVLPRLQPEGWLPIVPYYAFYLLNKNCFPVKYSHEGRIVGIGSLLMHIQTGWLAHIIVDTAFRGFGIGTAITRSLINLARSQGCRTLSLVSTPLGAPIYRKLGFTEETTYSFLRGTRFKPPIHTTLTRMTSNTIPSVLALDNRFSGEERHKLLAKHWRNALCTVEGGAVTGYYLPTLGEGFIAAVNAPAGLQLMAVKHAVKTFSALPVQNHEAIAFLKKHGYVEFRQGFRMVMGKSFPWRPENIFGRIGGNFG